MQCTSRRNRTLTGVSVCVCMCVYMWMCIATALSFRIRSISEWYLNAWQKVTEAELSEWKEMHINSLRIDTFHTAEKKKVYTTTVREWEIKKEEKYRECQFVHLVEHQFLLQLGIVHVSVLSALVFLSFYTYISLWPQYIRCGCRNSYVIPLHRSLNFVYSPFRVVLCASRQNMCAQTCMKLCICSVCAWCIHFWRECALIWID